MSTPTRPLDVSSIAATGVGSMPGTQPDETARMVLDELPDLPHLVELPQRGPGADMVGRTSALLVDLHVDLQPSGWRLVDRAGHDEHRASSYLSHDLDALEEASEQYAGPFKVQVCGPWTLAAALQLPRGEPALSDAGAVRDIAASLAEAVAAHVADVRRRVPGARVVVQLDEPSLPLVLGGRIRSMSGLRVVEPVPDADAETVLRRVVEAADAPVVVHCCADSPPLALLCRSGAVGVSLDLTLLGERADDALGTVLEAGIALFAGLVGSSADQLSDVAATVGPVRRLWWRLGLDPQLLAAQVVVTPTCGLAGVSPASASGLLHRCRAAGRLLAEDPEG